MIMWIEKRIGICLTMQILVFYYTGFEGVDCRRYDLEAEAGKLYGEDLQTVLRRFRRTPEYMNIIDDKINEMWTQLDHMMEQSTYAWLVKLKQQINNTLSAAENDEAKTKPGGRSAYNRRQHDQTQPSVEVSTSTLSPVEKLDEHENFHYVFTVQERNNYKDLGFEFAGQAIHSMIQSMGPEDTSFKSTRFSVSDGYTQTEHVTKHKVTEASTDSTKGTKEPSVGESFRASNPRQLKN